MRNALASRMTTRSFASSAPSCSRPTTDGRLQGDTCRLKRSPASQTIPKSGCLLWPPDQTRTISEVGALTPAGRTLSEEAGLTCRSVVDFGLCRRPNRAQIFGQHARYVGSLPRWHAARRNRTVPACSVGTAVFVGRATSRARCLPLTSTISRGDPPAGIDNRRDRGSLAHVRSSLSKRSVYRSTRGTTLLGRSSPKRA